MPTDHRATLAKIRRFDQLVAYLRDEMGWPIANGEDFEELTFEYTPEELGIDAKNAAKIQEIKRLRPLTPSQPWGIFFVKFEPKRLPVVALRRILGQVALKKRASANKSERQAWAADDLLFVSNYGEGDERRISFAHFSSPSDGADLPTLKVLGWDNLDTPLHLDAVARELTAHLAWPDDADDADAWRERWRAAFTLRHREVITTSKTLSERLAELARAIRDRIKTALAIETETGPLTKLMKAFQTALVHDLDEAGFADMYAQTIAYGLLSARITDPTRRTADDFAAHMRTNPFLRELMETFLHVGGRRGKAGGPGIDFDELGVSEVVDLLDQAKMEAVVRDFGDRNPQEDPVIHFYEHFLAAYDKKQKVSRGVFYTPRPVVSYIVRSVDELLRTDFGLEDGLADTTTWGEIAKLHEDLKIPDGTPPDQAFVQILDPATGTGTFLVEVIDLIYQTMVGKWKAQGLGEKKIRALWNEYVPKHLLPRLHGYELLMAPYAIAHLKIGLKLYETGYRFGSDERARVYLTNALEPPRDFSDRLAFDVPPLAHEAGAVAGVKLKQRFTVLVGNPPYAGRSANLTDEARELVERFKFVKGERLKERGALAFEMNLQDDYIKFIALSQDLLRPSGIGVLGIICNHGFIDNPTLRGVRWSLLDHFEQLWILDLHGNVNRGERAPDGTDDQNVFDIKDTGVAILLARAWSGESAKCSVLAEDLWGDRETRKYPFLMSESLRSIAWKELDPSPDLFLFRRLSVEGREYQKWPRVDEIFGVHSIGMITARDSYVIDFDPAPVIDRAEAFRDSKLNDAETCEALGIPQKKGWNITRARRKIREAGDLSAYVRPLLYRPFDIRFVFYHQSLIWGMSWPVMQHVIDGDNLVLITSRMTKGESFAHALVARHLSEKILLSSKTSNNAFAFPLRLKAAKSALRLGESRQELNVSSDFLERLALAMDVEQAGRQSLPVGVTAEDILHYIYSILYSRAYRERYEELLRTDFPRIPLPRGIDLFVALSRRGAELAALHLLDSPELDKPLAVPVGEGLFQVDKVSWSDGTVWIDDNRSRGFENVPQEVWTFLVGGYQVCEKWLKDRQARGGKNARAGRVLSADEIAHYQKIVVALDETIRIMAGIDEVIEAHGGWPGAFQPAARGAADDAALANVAEDAPSYVSARERGDRG